MFEKILYPTDFSECAEKAVPYIKELKKAGAKEVVVIHILDERSTAYGVAPEAKFLLELERETLGGVEGVKKRLEKAGFKAKTIVRRGVPAKEILKTASAEKVSLIVLGSTGKGMLQEALLGSTSEDVIRNSKKPVLLVKP